MEEKRFEHIMGYLDFDDLNDWEQEFVESVETRFKTLGFLTERQEDKLEQIFRKQNES